MSNSSAFLPPRPPPPGGAIAHYDVTNIPSPYYPTTPDYNNLMDHYFNYHCSSGFEVSDHHLDLEVDQQPFISSNNGFEASNVTAPFVSSQSVNFTQEMASTGSSAGSFDDNMQPLDYHHHHMQEKFMRRDEKRAKVEGHVVAIRTQTQLEILDDGFKWRKYGKKMVKSNPNPRHYYKCSIGGCKVKKRVERDGEDSSILITTYDGKHNHESPASSVVYCDRLPFLMLRPSQSDGTYT